MGWSILIGVVVGLLLVWALLIGALWLAARNDAAARDPAAPDPAARDTSVRDALRVLPDVVRLVSRLSRAPEVPRRVRLGLLVLLAYLASPVDLVPDFIPMIGYADDAVVVALTLRWVVRTAGTDALQRHWPGTTEGLDAVRRLARITRTNGNGT